MFWVDLPGPQAGDGVRVKPVLNAVVRMEAEEQHLPRTRTWMSWENEVMPLPRRLPELGEMRTQATT